VLKTLDKYILLELLTPFLVGTLTVVMMFQANVLIADIGAFQSHHAPLTAVLEYAFYRTPGFLKLTFPIGIALASSLSISRIARESELTALRSAGVRFLRIILPILVVGSIVAVGNFYIVEKIIPESERAAGRVKFEYALKGGPMDTRTNVVLHLRNMMALFGTIYRDKQNHIMIHDALLVNQTKSGTITFYVASTGFYADGLWTFETPFKRDLRNDQLIQASTISDLKIKELISVSNLFAPRTAQEQTASQLAEAISEGKRYKKDVTALEVAYYEKFSVPFACIVFALTGPIFAVLFSRSGAFMGVLLSILLVMAYYNIHIIGTEIIGKNGWLTPWLSAWFSNIIFIFSSLFVIRRIE